MTTGAAVVPGQLPVPGIDRRAVRPPFGFAIDIPEPWIVLDLDPRTSAQWVRQLVRRRGIGTRRTAREAWAAAAVVRDVIAALQAQGVLLAAILAGRIGEEVVGASITLGWERSPSSVDLDALGLSLARASPGADELVLGTVGSTSSRCRIGRRCACAGVSRLGCPDRRLAARWCCTSSSFPSMTRHGWRS